MDRNQWQKLQQEIRSQRRYHIFIVAVIIYITTVVSFATSLAFLLWTKYG